MEYSLESPTDEVARLRRCLNDLVNIMALPALWADGEPCEILGSLLEALREMLRLTDIGLQQARPLGEQKRLARTFDERVAQRTNELAAINEALKTEVVERQRAEEARRETERES